MKNNQDYAPKPGDIQGSGFAFTVAGGIVAALGVFIAAVEMFNDADLAPMLIGALLVIVGILVAIAGYAKRTADATTALYLLNYQEVNASRAEQ